MAFIDNFNRANASLEASPTASGGGDWVHDGLVANALQIASNGLRCNTTDGTGSAYKTPNQGSADHYVQYKVDDITTSTGPFACCRLADRSNFVGIRTGSDGPTGFVQVYRRVSGSLTNLYFSASGTVAVGDIIRLECSGTNFTVKKNGAVIFGPTAIGATLTSSDTGMVARTTTGSFFDDFEAGALSGDTSGSPSGNQVLASVGDASSSLGAVNASASPDGNEVLASAGNADSAAGTIINVSYGPTGEQVLASVGNASTSAGGFTTANLEGNQVLASVGDATSFTVPAILSSVSGKEVIASVGNASSTATTSASVTLSGNQLTVSVDSATTTVVGGSFFAFVTGNQLTVSVKAPFHSLLQGKLNAAFFSDTFNRPDNWMEATPISSSGGTWLHDGLILNAGGVNTLKMVNATASPSGTMWRHNIGTADQWVAFAIHNLTGNSFVCLRAENINKYVGIRALGQNIEVFRVNSGFTQIYNANHGVVVGDILQLILQGEYIEVRKNGFPVVSGLLGSSAFASTYVGVHWRQAIQNPWIDNFNSGTIGPVTVTGISGNLISASVGEAVSSILARNIYLSDGTQVTVSTKAPFIAASADAGVGPPTSPLLFSDDFNRDAGKLEDTPVSSSGGTWVHDGIRNALMISGGQIYSTDLDEGGSAYTATPFVATGDHFIEFKANSISQIYGPAISCRLGDHKNFIAICHGATTAVNWGFVEVWRGVNGVLSRLYTSGDGGFAVGDTLKLATVGTRYYVFKNDRLTTSGQIGFVSLNSGKTGIIGGGVIGGPFYDNFRTGTQEIGFPTGQAVTVSVGDVTVETVIVLTTVDVTGPQLVAGVGSVIVSAVNNGYGDNFNRADAALEASPLASGGWVWTHDGLIAGAFEIKDNKLRCDTAEHSASAYKTPSLGSRDHYVQAKVVTGSMSGGPLIACRVQDNDNYVGLRLYFDEIEVFRRVGGSSTELFHMEPPYLEVGDIVALGCVGPKFYVLHNGHIIHDDFIGALMTSQNAGVIARTDTGTYFDDFKATALGINQYLVGTEVIVGVGNAQAGIGVDVNVTGQLLTASVGSVEASAGVSFRTESFTLFTYVGDVQIVFGITHLQTGENLEVTVSVGNVSIMSPDFAWDPASDMPDGSLSNHNKTVTAPAGGFAYANSLKTHSAIYGFFETEFRSFYAEVTFTAENGGRPYGRVGLIAPGFPPGFEIYLELETGNIVDAADGHIWHVHMLERISNGDVVCIHFYPLEGWVRFKLNGGPWNNDAVIPWTPRQDYYANFLWLEADKCGLGDGAVVYETPHSSPYFTKMVQVGTGPRLRRNRLNDLPVFDFNNSPLRTNASDNIFSGRREIAAVFKGGAGSGNRRIVDQSPEATGIFVDTRSNGTEVGTGDRVAAGAGNYISYNKDDWTIFLAEKPGTFKNLSVNGGLPTTFTGINNAGTITNPVTVGARNVDATLPLLNTEVAEVIVRGGLTGLRDEIEGYLAHKWGLAYLLPDSHLYKYDHPEGEIKVIDTTANWAIYAEIGHERLSVTVTATLNTGDTPFAYPPPTEPYVDDWASYDPEKTIVFAGIPPVLTVSVGSVTVPQAIANGWDNRKDVPDGFLINGDKTATATPSLLVYSTVERDWSLGGPLHTEVTVVGTGLSGFVGVYNPDYPGDDVVLDIVTGDIKRNGAVVIAAAFPPIVSGDVIGVMALGIFFAPSVSFRVNGSATSATTYLSAGGRVYPIYAEIQSSAANITINTGDTPYAFPIGPPFGPWYDNDVAAYVPYQGLTMTASRGTVTVTSHNIVYLEGLELSARAGNIVTRHDKVTLTGFGLTVSAGEVTSSLPEVVDLQDAFIYGDDFNRANGALNAAPASGGWTWTHDGLIAGAMTVSGNQMNCATGSSPGSAYKTPSVETTDHYVQYKPTSTVLSPFAACRLADNNNFVGIRVNAGASAEVYSRVGGAFDALWVGGAASYVLGDTLRLECRGTNFRVLKNGVEIKTWTAIGASLTNVGTGVVARSFIGIWADDFEAGTLNTSFGLTTSVGDATTKVSVQGIVSGTTLWNNAWAGFVTIRLGAGATPYFSESLKASVGNVSVVTKVNVNLIGEQVAVSAGNAVGSVPFRITETGFGLTVSTKSPTVNVGVSVTLTKTTQLTVLRGTLSYDEPWTPAPVAGSEVWTMIEGHN